jgi:hypothetical protein
VDLRRAFFSRAMRIFDDERVKRTLADPRAMDVFLALVRWKDRADRLVRRVYRRRQPPGS